MSHVLAVLVASLLGSPHCAAMCGGFVCFYAGSGDRRGLAGHAAYHVGRLVSYTALGLLAGALGARLEAAGRLAGIGRVAAIVAGTLMVAWGLARIGAAYGVRVPGLAPSPALQRRLGGVVRAVRERPPVVRAATLGLVTTLLPCGWLWAFVLTAGGTASPLGGALVMATFWAGTLPMLTALGVTVQRAAGPLRARLPLISATVLVVLGLLSIAGRMQAPAHAHLAPASSSHGQHGQH
ncbi:MAG: sulfite exporter TauE/SafE family protein [Gemmatirosa sp.]